MASGSGWALVTMAFLAVFREGFETAVFLVAAGPPRPRTPPRRGTHLVVTVLDASAVLAFVYDEPGAEVVEQALREPCRVAAPNWSEVVQMIACLGGDWRFGGGGARFCRSPIGCLATAECFDTTVLTADRAWGEAHPVAQIR